MQAEEFLRWATTMLVALFLAASPTSAASLTGRVTTPEGLPAFGAMVSVFNEARDRRETVYAGADGRYAIHTPFAGILKIRARLANFEDVLVARKLAGQ